MRILNVKGAVEVPGPLQLLRRPHERPLVVIPRHKPVMEGRWIRKAVVLVVGLVSTGVVYIVQSQIGTVVMVGVNCSCRGRHRQRWCCSRWWQLWRSRGCGVNILLLFDHVGAAVRVQVKAVGCVQVVADGRPLVVDLRQAYVALVHHRRFGVGGAGVVASSSLLQAGLVLAG